jgi:hypothetical protein
VDEDEKADSKRTKTKSPNLRKYFAFITTQLVTMLVQPRSSMVSNVNS